MSPTAWIVATSVLGIILFFILIELMKHDQRVKNELKRKADQDDDTTKFYYD